MVSIKINGKEIYIPEDTTLSLEMNNSVFNTEKIEGDVIFTFDVPAQRNDVIFQHARYVYVQRKKSYEAIVAVGGIEIAKGSLIIQKATTNTYSCGVVMNPYPIGFADTLLKDNDYGELGELSLKRTGYSSGALFHLMVKDSLEPDSNFKFGEFYDEIFYENDIKLYAKNRVNCFCIVPHQNGILNFSIYRKYDEYAPNFVSRNFGYAPQIKLMYLLNALIKSMGYTLKSPFVTDYQINRIFYQSMYSLFMPNTYATQILLKNHTPNLTNAEFINTICSLFGCTYYIDSSTKTIEIATVKDLSKAKHIDLSRYVLDKETSIEHNENNRYTYTLDCFVQQEIKKEDIFLVLNDRLKLLNDIGYYSGCYYAETYARKIVFVPPDNAYYKSQFNEDDKNNPFWEWVLYSGNTQTISNKTPDGNHAGTLIKPNAKIPTRISINYFDIMEVPLPSINSFTENNSTDFDLILTYYSGESRCEVYWAYGGKSGSTYGGYSQMNPVAAAFPLTVDGENSIGQKYAMPYLKLLGNHEPITMQFLLPLHIFLEVINLLKPQNTAPETQTRWIMLNNIKMLPIQMKFEFTTEKQYIKAELKMAKINH
jgi:hypothetical protein